MLYWLMENLATVLICLALAAVVTAIVAHLIRSRKRGESGCGCGCGGCPMSASCGKSAGSGKGRSA